MKTEHVIKREDGSSIMISIASHHDLYKDGNVVYRWDVKRREKGKKKWIHIINQDNYEYRRMSMEERQAQRHSLYMDFVTESEVLDAMNAHWNKMKPNKDQLSNC